MCKHVCIRWALDLSSWSPTLPQLACAVAAVQSEERVRLMKFHFIDDFLASLVGRLLMRKFISAHSILEYHAVQFGRDLRGKPYWIKPVGYGSLPRLSFNVSHHGDMVVLAGVVAKEDAVTLEAAAASNISVAVSEFQAIEPFGVGVDVMKIEYSGGKALSEFFRAMQRKFSTSEWSYITRPHCNEEDRLKAFMRLWCLKESYVKELGVGITIDLERISFAVDTSHELKIHGVPLTQTTLRLNDVPQHNWHFEEHLLFPNHCVAIALRDCSPATGKFELLRMDDLVVPTPEAQKAAILEYSREALQKQRKT